MLHKASEVNEGMINRFFSDIKLPVLTEDHCNLLDTPIEQNEIMEAIAALKPNTAPGPDGFTSEFYKIFSGILTPFLQQILMDCIKEGRMPGSRSLAKLIVLPKQGRDLSQLQSYRPISLLNTGYKIVATILAKILGKILDQYDHRDQSGFT